MSILFTDGTIITMSPERDIIWDGALYVRDGRIVDVGETEPMVQRWAEEADRRVNADRRVLLPGLVNTHCHSTHLACRGRAEDVSNWDAIWGVMGSIQDAMTPDDAYAASRLAYVEMLKSGTTAVVDSGNHMFRVGEAAEETGIRAFLHCGFRDADTEKIRERGIYEYCQTRGERQLRRAVDLVEKFHGRAAGRIRGLIGPHATDVCSPQLLERARAEADRLGVGTTIHLAQNRFEPEQCIEAWGSGPARTLERAGLLGPDFIGAHAIHLTDEDIEILGRNCCSVAHNPQINAKRADIAPVSDLMDAGVNVALGSDNMFYDLVEVTKVAQLVWRLRAGDPTRPDPQTILKMACINGARALGMEDCIGSLEPGKRADVIMINCDRPRYIPRLPETAVANLVHFGNGADVEMTLVDGRILVDDFRYVGGDERAISDAAQQSGEQVWERARRDWSVRMSRRSDPGEG